MATGLQTTGEMGALDEERHHLAAGRKGSVAPPSSNLQRLLAERPPLLLGISPGNPYYYKEENLKWLLEFADRSSDLVKVCLLDDICEHTHRAAGSPNPYRRAKQRGKRLRHKLQTVMDNMHSIRKEIFTFIDWATEVEPSKDYQGNLNYVKLLFETHGEFRDDVRQTSLTALTSVSDNRRKQKHAYPGFLAQTYRAQSDVIDKEGRLDLNLDEGVLYLLKELAFFMSLSAIYKNISRAVYIYHRSWMVADNLFSGHYDGIARQEFNVVCAKRTTVEEEGK